MIGLCSFVLILYLMIGVAVFIACLPVNITPLTAKERFVQCFTALFAGVLWPVPVVVAAASVLMVLFMFVMSLAVERRR